MQVSMSLLFMMMIVIIAIIAIELMTAVEIHLPLLPPPLTSTFQWYLFGLPLLFFLYLKRNGLTIILDVYIYIYIIAN